MISCYCRCKDTNFKANHNYDLTDEFTLSVVIADAKILILKQITTLFAKLAKELELLLQMQRYEIELRKNALFRILLVFLVIFP